MTFAAALWLLTGLLVVAVLLLHSHRKHRVEVPSLMLWRALALPPGTRKSRRRWPPLTLPLILQIAAVVLATLALALPHLTSRHVPNHLILVLDGSPEMLVDEGGQTRFDLARDAVTALLHDAGDVAPAQVSLVLAAARPQPVAARWDGRADLFAPVLNRLAATAAPADWTATAGIIAGLVDPAQDTRIILLSAAAPDPALADLRPGVERMAIGTDLARADLEATVMRGVSAGEWQITATATFLGGQDTATLTVGYADAPGVTPLPWAERTLTPDDDGTDSVALTVTLPGPGVLTLTLDGSVRARFVLDPPAQAARLLYIGPGSQPLIQALQVQPGLAFFQADSLPADLSGFAGVIVDRVTLPRQPEVPTLWIGAAGVADTPTPTEPSIIATPDPDAWSVTHPLARAVDWTRLSIDAATRQPLADGAEVLVRAGDLPLVTVADGPGPRQVWLAFDPAATDWPGTPDLALFAGAVLEQLGIVLGDTSPMACAVAVPCAVPGLTPGTVLTDEAGGTTTVPAGPFIPMQPGFLAFAGPDAPGVIAVNARPAPTAFVPQEGAVPGLPRAWTFGLVLAALACIAADTILAGRRRGRFGVPPALGLVATALAIAALVPAPLPLPQPAREIIRLGDGTQLLQAGPALDLAAAAVPPATEGIVLLAGAPLTRPQGHDLDQIAATLAARDSTLRIDRVEQAPAPGSDIIVLPPDLPSAVLVGEPVVLTARVLAPAAGDSTLRLFRDGEEIAAQPVSLIAGANRIEAVLPAAEGTGALIEVAVDTGTGDDPANNRAGRYLPVPPLRPVAVISPSPDHGAAMANLLVAEGLTVDVMAPADMPQYLRDWLPYGGVVLLNTPAITMTVRQQEILAQAVGDQGLGLLILGGVNAFGPGGYYETPLEDLSPLSAKVPRDAPEVGMVFVLDRSGSMQQAVGDGNRLDVAKRATLAAMDLLNPQSQVGIAVFDAEAQVVLPFGPLDRARAEAALNRVDPGGGTAVYPGLVAALDMLRDSQSPARHVIVMTDGLSQPGDWPGIIGELRALGATVSGVAIGQGSDRTVVEIIAGLGGGAAHVTTDFAALPSILSQEAMMFAAPLEEGASQPEWRDTALPFLAGLPGQLPPVDGFVLTTAKPEARLIMTAPDSEGEDAPLMAEWRYGNGQVMAFASDATGPWTAGWHTLPGYGGLWAGALRAFQPLAPGPGLNIAAHGDAETVVTTLTALDRDGAAVNGLTPRLTVTAPDGRVTETAMIPNATGSYDAAIPLNAPGRHDLTVTSGDDDPVTAMWHHSWPATHAPAPADGAVWLARMTGGDMITADAAAALRPGIAWHLRPDFRPWLVLALILFMAELVRRYAELPRLFGRRIPTPSTAAAPHAAQGD